MNIDVVYLVLYIAAFICFVLALFGQPKGTTINLVALGLALWVAVSVISRAVEIA